MPCPVFDGEWKCPLLIAAIVLVFIVAFVAVCYKLKCSRSKTIYGVEVEETAPEQNEVQNSPIFCEGIDFSFSSSEPLSEGTEMVKIEVNENTHVEISNSEYEYCDPINFDYENMGPAQASGDYASPYELEGSINSGYVTTHGVEDDYEYPRTNTSSLNDEYQYAYGWMNSGFPQAMSSSDPMVEYTCLDREKMNDTSDETYQTLSLENPGEENEAVPIEYVAIM